MAKPDKDIASANCPACGRFYFDDQYLSELRGKDADVRSRLSSVTRAASDRRQYVTISDDSIPELLTRAIRPASITVRVDLLIQLLAGRAGTDFQLPVRFNHAIDWPLLGAESPGTVSGIIGLAVEMELIRKEAIILTVKGWQRAEQLRLHPVNSRRVFVAMWFGKEVEDAWLNGLKVGIEKSKYFTAHRVDSEEHNEKIDDRIIADIRRSSLMVADFTKHRGGVYFEAGFAMGLGIPVIWTCRDDHMKDAHFDTRQYNHIRWNTPADLAEKIDYRLRALYLPVGWDA